MSLSRLLLLLLVGISTRAVAQSTAASLLWSIEGQGIKKSYIFGTVHMLPAKDFAIKPKVKRAIQKSDIMVMELDLDNPMVQVELMKDIKLENDDKLSNYLSDEDAVLLSNYMEDHIGSPLSSFDHLKPFFLTSMLIPTYIEGDVASFERHLVEIAQSQKMEIIGLEKAEGQLKIFDEIPIEKQLSQIMDLVKDKGEAQKKFDAILSAYKTEDIHRLVATTLEQIGDDNYQKEAVLWNRNKDWVEKIPQMAAKEKCFIAVGAAHLGGDQGVISLLKERGYTLTPIIK
ncbi:TraB/GumN family protein [Luteibaculum oceani]|uniref:TraB/GumN family protein n=1 Tax=Luteibaculum oceani TaxID=1294296 RepID=A0A5C6VJY0_9FLAO|nr:TraB/GumN family protein [Luteibaculum oceani]TXC85229.1 TraB/GumN family protein [Luteibaculum oceani]